MLKPFDLRRVLTALEMTGATSVPLLTASAEQALLREAVHYQYHREADVVGSGDRVVRQEMASLRRFPPRATSFTCRRFVRRAIPSGYASGELMMRETWLTIRLRWCSSGQARPLLTATKGMVLSRLIVQQLSVSSL